MVLPKDVVVTKTLTASDIVQAAQSVNLKPAHIYAVIKTESRGKGFLPDGRPIILFEGHQFYKDIKAKGNKNLESWAKEYPSIVYPKWTKQFYKGGASEYLRYNQAAKLDADSAMKATSWGMFQIMGFNYKYAGFNNVAGFVDKMKETERAQLDAFIEFLDSAHLIAPLRDNNWRAFAKGYNGAGYEQNAYHIKLENAFDQYDRVANPSITARLERKSDDGNQTLGKLQVFNGSGTKVFECDTLELPWKGNARSISCIRAGSYKVVGHNSQDHPDSFHLLDLPGRDAVLIHVGNYFSDSRGCILVGNGVADINKDGLKDITESKATLAKLKAMMPPSWVLTILDAPGINSKGVVS
jgi:hypothetical protein